MNIGCPGLFRISLLLILAGFIKPPRRSGNYANDRAGSIMNLEWRVKCDEPSASLPGQLHHPGVVHLLMSQGPPIEHRLGGRRRLPKLVVRMLAVPLEQGRGSTGTHRFGSIGGIRGQADERQLRQSACGPPGSRLAVKPAASRRVVLVVRPGQSQQDVDVQQGGLHLGSFASSSAAREEGITAASSLTRNTGSPPLRAKPRASPFNARRTNSDSTCPSLLPDALARLLAA